MIDESTISRDTMDLRERLQAVEIKQTYIHHEVTRTATLCQAGITSMQHLEGKVGRLNRRLDTLTRVSGRLEMQERRLSVIIEMIKYLLPAVVVGLAAIERFAPGSLLRVL